MTQKTTHNTLCVNIKERSSLW